MSKTKKYKPSILTSFGVIFLISAIIIPIQNVIVWGPDFVYDFYTSSEITAEKVSIAVMIVGIVLILVGYKKQVYVE